MRIYIAKYEDSLYPEDNYSLGCFTSEYLADKSIEETLAYERSRYSRENNHTKEWNYGIEEHDVIYSKEIQELFERLYESASEEDKKLFEELEI